MNSFLLSEYFAVIGKSIRDEDDISTRIQADDSTRLFLIGKFGIGFISTYILARAVQISTTYDGAQQVNVEISGIDEPFVYNSKSSVGRPKESIGTTVRVYLKDEFRLGGAHEFDALDAVKRYCRHVTELTIINNGQRTDIVDNWNTHRSAVSEIVGVRHRFELRLGFSSSATSFIASNAGFLVSNDPEHIMPPLMPKLIGGEINFFPGVVDLNISRDAIVESETTKSVRRQIEESIKKILIKVVSDPPPGSHTSLRDTLMIYLELAIEHEGKKTGRSVSSLFSPSPVDCPHR